MHISLFFLQTVYSYIQLFELQACSIKSVFSQCSVSTLGAKNVYSKSQKSTFMFSWSP